MEGDAKAGFTIFFADDGLDTGPVLLMRETDVEPDDTVSTLYERFMFPEGIKAMTEAVALVATGNYPKTVQPVEGATCVLHAARCVSIANIISCSHSLTNLPVCICPCIHRERRLVRASCHPHSHST
jgi:hypothetical protein